MHLAAVFLVGVANLAVVELLEQARAGAAGHEQEGRVADKVGEQVPSTEDVVVVAFVVSADADAKQIEEPVVEVGLAGLGARVPARRGGRGWHGCSTAHADPQEQRDQAAEEGAQCGHGKFGVLRLGGLVKLRKRQAIPQTSPKDQDSTHVFGRASPKH